MNAKYKPNHKSYAHQAEAQRRLRLQPAFFALLMAMRTGKTKVIIDNFGELELRGMTRDLLVIAPAGSYQTWPREIEEHASADLRKRLDVHLWAAGQVSGRAMRLQEQFLQGHGPRALVVDVEALSSVARLQELCVTYLSAQQKRWPMVVVDESTVIKNPESNRTSFINDKLRPLASYRRIMSGLPTPNSPFDIFSQFYFLEPEILGWSYANHKAKYADLVDVCFQPTQLLVGKLQKAMLRMPPNLRRADGKAYMIPGFGFVEPGDLDRGTLIRELKRHKVYIQMVEQVKKYKNEDQLAKIIKPYSYRVRLEDTYDMPEKVYMRRDVDMHPEQKRIYTDLKNKSMAELSTHDFVTPNMVITRMLRMHQVLCGHVVDENGKLHSIPEYRTGEVMEVLEEYDGKAIIWCSYDYNVRGVAEAITKRYGPGSVARFWGGNRKTREEEEAQFKKNPKCRFMVATPSAGGRGRTWHMANLLIYYSSTNNLEHRDQSEERGGAVGKKDLITIMDLITPGTVDVRIIESLRKKINMATTINGDEWRKWLI